MRKEEESSIREIIIKNLSDTIFKKILKRKEEDGFGDKDWSEWLTFLASATRLHETIHEQIQRGTKENLLKIWMENFAQNIESGMRNDPTIADLIQDVQENDMRESLQKYGASPLGTAVVIGAGAKLGG